MLLLGIGIVGGLGVEIEIVAVLGVGVGTLRKIGIGVRERSVGCFAMQLRH